MCNGESVSQSTNLMSAYLCQLSLGCGDRVANKTRWFWPSQNLCSLGSGEWISVYYFQELSARKKINKAKVEIMAGKASVKRWHPNWDLNDKGNTAIQSAERRVFQAEGLACAKAQMCLFGDRKNTIAARTEERQGEGSNDFPGTLGHQWGAGPWLLVLYLFHCPTLQISCLCRSQLRKWRN